MDTQAIKKRTARLAYMAWKEKGLIDLLINPVAISYSTFTHLPISVYLKSGKVLDAS